MQGLPQGDDLDGDAAVFGEINITPLTDVFLVLLIILMVVSTAVVEEEKESSYQEGMLAERALQIMTPEGAGDQDVVPEDVVVSVALDGSVFIMDKAVPPHMLDTQLRGIAEGNPLARVILRADEKLSYAAIMKVLKRCSDNGLNNVALASREP